MGNTESAKKRQQRKKVLKQAEEEWRKIRPFTTKEVLLLHNSNASQLKIARYFRDALLAKAKESVFVDDFVNIADGNEIPRGLAWLNETNNVVLICLTSESVEQFQRIIHEKGFADEIGKLHPKVFTISFGKSLTSEWPPKGLKKGSVDARDFHFGFADVEKIRPQDFENSLRMNSLIAAMRGTF